MIDLDPNVIIAIIIGVTLVAGGFMFWATRK